MFIKQLNYRIKTEYIISYLKNISDSHHVGLEKKTVNSKNEDTRCIFRGQSLHKCQVFSRNNSLTRMFLFSSSLLSVPVNGPMISQPSLPLGKERQFQVRGGVKVKVYFPQ